MTGASGANKVKRFGGNGWPRNLGGTIIGPHLGPGANTFGCSGAGAHAGGCTEVEGSNGRHSVAGAIIASEHLPTTTLALNITI